MFRRDRDKKHRDKRYLPESRYLPNSTLKVLEKYGELCNGQIWATHVLEIPGATSAVLGHTYTQMFSHRVCTVHI